MNFYKIIITVLFFYSSPCCAQQNLLVAVQSPKDSVVIFDPIKGIKKGQLKVGFLPHEITYDPDTKRCFISNFGLQDYDMRIGKPGNSIAIIDPWSTRFIKTVYTCNDTTRGNAPHGIKVRPGKWKELFMNAEVGGDSMLIYDLHDISPKRKFSLPKSSHNFIFSSDGTKLWVMAASEGVYELNPNNGFILHHQSFDSPIRGLVIGEKWIVASGKNEIFLLSKNDLHTIKHFKDLGVGQILYSNVTVDQKYILAPAVDENKVLVINVLSGKILYKLDVGKGPINVQVTQKFAYVSHDEDEYITTINLKNFKAFKRMKAYGTNGLILLH